tara:strand:- start:456 stop:803 length:348 start_codon:yes stop_codon:yes gene_type:complete
MRALFLLFCVSFSPANVQISFFLFFAPKRQSQRGVRHRRRCRRRHKLAEGRVLKHIHEQHVFSLRIFLRWNFCFGFVQRYGRCVRREGRSEKLFEAAFFFVREMLESAVGGRSKI